MIEYKGPESLRESVEKTYKKIGKDFRGKPQIEVGLSHYGIDYSSLGFKDESDYFKAIDSKIAEVKRVSDKKAKLMDQRIDKMDVKKYKTFEEGWKAVMEGMTEEEKDLDYQYDVLMEQLRSIGSGHYINFKKTFARPLTDITFDDLNKAESVVLGGYMNVSDKIYFDPIYIFEAFQLEDSEDFQKTLLHELTHREVGDRESGKEKMRLFKKYAPLQKKVDGFRNSDTFKKAEAMSETEEFERMMKAYEEDDPRKKEIAKSCGFTDQEIEALEHIDKVSDQAEFYGQQIVRIAEKERALKITAVDEGLGFAASGEENPDFSSHGYVTKGIKLEDYQKAYDIFKDMLKEKYYEEVVKLAKDVMNKSYRENRDAVKMLAETAKQ